MVEWFEKFDDPTSLRDDFTERDKQFLLIAYRNTFCNSEEGRQVLCHLKTMLEGFVGTDAERMVARDLLDAILNNCGIVGNMKIIKALSNVAVGFNIPKAEEEIDNLNV